MKNQQLPSAVVRGSLRDGLLVCLGLAARDPARYEAAAVAWHARWCRELPGVGFAESLAALSALQALAGPDPIEASRSLCAACAHDGLEELAQVMESWLERNRPPGETRADGPRLAASSVDRAPQRAGRAWAIGLITDHANSSL